MSRAKFGGRAPRAARHARSVGAAKKGGREPRRCRTGGRGTLYKSWRLNPRSTTRATASRRAALPTSRLCCQRVVAAHSGPCLCAGSRTCQAPMARKQLTVCCQQVSVLGAGCCYWPTERSALSTAKRINNASQEGVTDGHQSIGSFCSRVAADNQGFFEQWTTSCHGVAANQWSSSFHAINNVNNGLVEGVRIKPFSSPRTSVDGINREGSFFELSCGQQRQ